MQLDWRYHIYENQPRATTEVAFTPINFRYFLRVTVVKRLSDLVREQDIIVHTLSQYPELNNSIKMEVGIEDCLHIEFEYNKSKWVPYGGA